MKFICTLLLTVLFQAFLIKGEQGKFLKEEKKLRELLQEFDDDVSKEEPQDSDEPRDELDMIAEDDADIEEKQLVLSDPCEKVHCSAGRACYVNPDTQKGECECIKECGFENDPRRRVCTNLNVTYNSDCEVYRQRCFCEEGVSNKCSDPEKFKHIHVEYFGECRNIPACSEDEKADFPRRMREWLFNVMDELSQRRELSFHYQQMKKEAENDRSKRWVNAAVWKWCDLDNHPHDNVVSRHELFPIKAPLQALEHCISEFLNGCDTDDNHDITLKEWGTCLELDEKDLTDRCEEMRSG